MTMRRQRGYTAVEVLSAMTLFAIGAAGVISMQKVTVQGSEDARRYDIGGNIANEWVARLQQDASFWTQPNSDFPGLMNISVTQWLSKIGTCFPNWCHPPAPPVIPAGRSGSFDSFGRDVAITDPESTYCAQYRLEWISNPGTPPNLATTGLMRAEVRVFWNRLERGPTGSCAAATPDAADAAQRYHFVYATTAIRENPQR